MKKDKVQLLLPARGRKDLRHDEDASSTGHGGTDSGTLTVHKMQQAFAHRMGLSNQAEQSGKWKHDMEQHDQTVTNGRPTAGRNGGRHHSPYCKSCQGRGSVNAHRTNKGTSSQEHHPLAEEEEEEEEERAILAKSGELLCK